MATEPRIGPIATAYVLILVIVGPLTARWTQPAVARIQAWRERDRDGKGGTGSGDVPAVRPAPAVQKEFASSAD